MGSLRYCNIFCKISNKVLIFSRHINTSSSQLATNSLSKQGKIFNKFFAASSKKKRKFMFDDCQAPCSEHKLNLGQHLRYNKENSRRVAVMNKLFMKHISDLLVTGNIGVDLLSKGLEISRVSMNQDFRQLNVFWGCNMEKNITDLENILPNVGFTLRHELSQLKVIGVVPRIIFIKDKNFTNAAKVDYLLRIADFGDDHIPLEVESDFKTDSLATQAKIKSPSEDETSDSEEEEAMPAMRHDVLCLDHQLIMNKIIKKMLRSRAIHRFEPNLVIKSEGNTDISPTPNVTETETMTKEERKQALAKFVLQRRLLMEKQLRNKHKRDVEVYMQELDDEELEDDYLEMKDYVDEDTEEKKYHHY